jgi:hypothetical protein
MASIGDCIGFIINTTLKVTFGGLFIAGAAGVALYCTKPDEKSLDKHLKNELKEHLPNIAANIVSGIAKCASSTKFDDHLIIVRRARIKYPNDTEKVYIGALGCWFDVSPSNNKTTVTHYNADGTSYTYTK